MVEHVRVQVGLIVYVEGGVVQEIGRWDFSGTDGDIHSGVFIDKDLQFIDISVYVLLKGGSGWWISDFGGWCLDTDSNCGQYCHFCGTIIGKCNDRNPYKRGTNTWLRQIRVAEEKLYLKSYYSWRYLGTAKSINFFLVN